MVGNKMKILLINHYAGTPLMGMEFRPYYFAREWTKMGHDVWIVAGDYSHLRKNNPKVDYDFQEETVEGVNYTWVKTGQYVGNGAKRALTMFRFVAKLWKKSKWLANKYQPDVVITSSTYPIDTFAGQKIAKYAKAKLIHEVHDMWPSTLYEIGGMSKWHPFVQVMQLGENSAYKRSDKVVSLAPYAKEYMVKHGLREDKFVHIPNGVVLEDWEQSQALPIEHEKILRGYREENKFIVGYFGGHALSNALDTLVDAAKYIDDEQVQIVLVGDGVEKKRLQEKVAENGLSNITFMSTVSKLCISELMNFFDCAYIGALDSPLYRFGAAMNKIYDVMMGEKPMLYAVGAPNNYVRRYDCGIDLKPGSCQSLVEGILNLKNMPEAERQIMGKNGKRAVVEYYNYEVLSKKFEDLFLE